MSPEKNTEVRFDKPDKSEIASATLKRRLVRDYGFSAVEANNLFADSTVYSPRNPYHNFLHHRESLWVGLQLAEEYIAQGKKIDVKVLAVSIMLHDAEDPNDPMHGSYESPEYEAAAILVRNRSRYGLSKRQAERGKGNILATAIDAPITTDEEEIMVISDVSNVGSNDPSFFNGKSGLLRVELLAKGVVRSAAQFDEKSAAILSQIWLKIAERNPKAEWLIYAGRNIHKFIEDATAPEKDDSAARKRLLGHRAVKEFTRIMQSQPDEKKS